MAAKNANRSSPLKNLDRLPPYSEDAERGVLGCLLLDFRGCWPKVAESLRAGEDCFYDLRNRAVFSALKSLAERDGHADYITLMAKLRDDRADVGVEYVSGLPDAVPSAANLGYYLGIVLDKYRLRHALRLATNIVTDCYEWPGEVDELMERFEKMAFSLRANSAPTEANLCDHINTYLNSVEAGWKQSPGLKTGFPVLDSVLGDMLPGNVIVLGGGTMDGKTSLALNIADNVMEAGNAVGFFTLEMSADEIVERWIASRSGISARRTRANLISDGEKESLGKWAAHLARKPLRICDNGGLNIAELRNRSRRWVADCGVRLIVIDYLQLIHSTRRKASRTEEVEQVSRECKAMAKELGVVVLALSQFSRDYKKAEREPRLDDLRQSGSVEQDADKVILMHKKNGVMKLIVAKNRNGPKGRTDCEFQADCYRFMELPEKEGVE